MTLLKKLQANVFFLATALFLQGCATKPPAPDFRIDGGTLQPAEQVVRLALHTSRTYPSRPMNSWWAVDIVAVDGKPIPPNTAVVQLASGKHVLQYSCSYKFQLNDTGGARSDGTTEFTMPAGTLYFPYVNGRMTSSKNYGAAGINSTGVCGISSFETANPRWLP